jgi:hypothetical protein
LNDDQRKEKITFCFIFLKTQAIISKAMDWEKAWFHPICNDCALPGLWQRQRIFFHWKGVERQGNRHFAIG